MSSLINCPKIIPKPNKSLSPVLFQPTASGISSSLLYIFVLAFGFLARIKPPRPLFLSTLMWFSAVWRSFFPLESIIERRRPLREELILRMRNLAGEPPVPRTQHNEQSYDEGGRELSGEQNTN